MKTTRATGTHRVTDTHPYLVTIVAPDGRTDKVVQCRTRVQALSVVEHEAEQAELYTLILLSRRRGRTQEPVARWAIGTKGLVRTPYRHNAAEQMDTLMRSARQAYAFGMTDHEVREYLMAERGASRDDAFLAAAAARVLLKESP